MPSMGIEKWLYRLEVMAEDLHDLDHLQIQVEDGFIEGV